MHVPNPLFLNFLNLNTYAPSSVNERNMTPSRQQPLLLALGGNLA
jgi:hypothetical protein